MTNVCFEGEFRYPKGLDIDALKNCDCLIVNSSIMLEKLIEHNMVNTPMHQVNFGI